MAENERKYLRFFEQVPAGLYVADEKGRIIEANNRFRTIAGLQPGMDITGINVLDLYANEEERERRISLLTSGGRLEYFESEWKCRDGSIIWVSENAVITHGPDGKRYCEASVEDITTRKTAVRNLYEAYFKLEDANRQLQNRTKWMNALSRLVFDLANKLDIDAAVNTMMQHISANFDYSLAFTLLFNREKTSFSLSNIDCRDVSVLKGLDISYEDSFTLDSGNREILLGGGKKASAFSLESLPAEHHKGDFYSLLKRIYENGISGLIMIPIIYSHRRIGQFCLAFSAYRDITEEENHFLTGMIEYAALSLENFRLYSKLRRSYDRLSKAQDSMKKQERLKAIGQIASGVSHDINNTLAPITLYVEAMLVSESDISERARKYLSVISKAVDDIEQITRRLRNYYCQIEESEPERINAAELFDEIIDLTLPKWQTMPDRDGIVIQIEKDIEDPESEVLGYRSDIRESLVNCVFNSADAMPVGGRIKLVQRYEPGFIVLSVEDNGVGMSAEQQQHCREPFYTTKGASGSGLGLAEVQGMIRRHDGFLDINSSPGAGTQIIMKLPRKSGSDEKLPVEMNDVELPPLKILCVDDDQLLLDSLAEILQLEGHEVDAVTNTRIGIEIFSDRAETWDPFQLVITALGMKGMDGYTFASEIKRIRSDTLIVMLTGWEDAAVQFPDLPENIDLVLAKPPRMKVLRQKVKSMLGGKDTG